MNVYHILSATLIACLIHLGQGQTQAYTQPLGMPAPSKPPSKNTQIQPGKPPGHNQSPTAGRTPTEKPTPPPHQTGQYMWPTGNKTRITRPYDPPQHNWNAGHRGIDLAYQVGAPIYAANDGTVAYRGTIAGTPVISINHPDGIRTTYQPVKSDLNTGDTVQRGQIIGHLHTGHAGNTLHWGALTGKDTYMNPLRLLYGTIRLKADR